MWRAVRKRSSARRFIGHVAGILEADPVDNGALRSFLHTVWAPVVTFGPFNPDKHRPLFDSNELVSSLDKIDINEISQLLEAGVVSSSDGTILVDPEFLDEFSLRAIGYSSPYHTLFPWLNVELVPRVLIISDSGRVNAPMDYKHNADNSVGTLLVNLNADYTGGALRLDYNGNTTHLTKKQTWTAMHRDTTFGLEPITEGRKVDMIFDIYSRGIFPQFDAVNYGPTVQEQCISLDDGAKRRVLQAVWQELLSCKKVVINLAHNYLPPKTKLCAANNDSDRFHNCISYEQLIGGDQSLYNLLKDHFDVSLEIISMQCVIDSDTDCVSIIKAHCITEHCSELHHHQMDTNKVPINSGGSMKLILSNRCHAENFVAAAPPPPNLDSRNILDYESIGLVVSLSRNTNTLSTLL